MDTAVSLVQAYLHINGYFTVAEYPVLEAVAGRHARSVTDLDILAFRFAGARHAVIGSGRHRRREETDVTVDPMLGGAAGEADMIVGEVKEGAARLNDALLDWRVLEVALSRFGCCSREHAAVVTKRLLSDGRATTPAGHAIRIVAFGDVGDDYRPGPWTTVPMRHVVDYVRAYLRQHWSVLRHAQVRDPGLAVLALLEKWGTNDKGRPISAETHHG